MSHPGFELQPVTRYEAPRYPSRWQRAAPPDASGERQVGPWEVLRWLVIGVLALWLAVGVIACGDRGRLGSWDPPASDGGLDDPDGGDPQDDAAVARDASEDDGDILMGVMSECTPEELYCADSQTLMTCDDYYWEEVDCDDYCAETYQYSDGCDATAEDPCQCYDMLDGGMAFLGPNADDE